MKKIVSIMLSVLCALLGAACGKNDRDKAVADAVLIGGFESIAELKTFLYTDEFHKAELNTDENYVTQGEASAKFTLRGTSAGVDPRFDLWLDTKYAGGKTDFGDVKSLTVDVFNPSDTEREFTLSFTTRKQGAVRATYVPKTYKLKKGKNKIIYAIDRAVAKDVCYMDNAEYVTFEFESSRDEPYVLYVDNLMAHITDEEIKSVTKIYKENELLFFDDYSDRFAVSTNTLRAQPSEAPTISICRDPRFIKSGSGSLQVTLAVTPSRPGMDDAPGITVSGDAVERVDFSKYSKVAFSVMGDAPETISNVSVEFYDVNDVNYNMICHLQNIYNWSQEIPSFKWHTMTADIKTMADAGLDMTKIKKINLYYGNKETGDPYSLYFDDFTLIP